MRDGNALWHWQIAKAMGCQVEGVMRTVWKGICTLLILGWVTERPAAASPKAEAKPATNAHLTEEQINDASFPDAPPTDHSKKRSGNKNEADPLLIKVQILLDRAHFSPGAIDGRDGANLKGALTAFAEAEKLPKVAHLDKPLFDRLSATSSDPVVTEYTITDADVKGPFTSIPPALAKQAAPHPMGYTDVREMLAERFHMQRDLLSALNPDKPPDKPGTVVLVAAVPPMGDGKVDSTPHAPIVTHVEVDKGSRRVKAYTKEETLVASYPASIGSEEKPAPTGRFKTKSVSFNPWYTYNPKYRFKGVKTRRKFSIRPGPNNPVGLVWIDLSAPSYGIHGTPEPENVGKTESHGCIRLTNWDARDLASHVEKGAVVDFYKK